MNLKWKCSTFRISASGSALSIPLVCPVDLSVTRNVWLRGRGWGVVSHCSLALHYGTIWETRLSHVFQEYSWPCYWFWFLLKMSCLRSNCPTNGKKQKVWVNLFKESFVQVPEQQDRLLQCLRAKAFTLKQESRFFRIRVLPNTRRIHVWKHRTSNQAHFEDLLVPADQRLSSDQLRKDFCEAILSANVPWNELENPKLRNFLDTNIGELGLSLKKSASTTVVVSALSAIVLLFLYQNTLKCTSCLLFEAN